RRRVHQLHRASGRHHGVQAVTARRAVPPADERGPQPLAAVEHEPRQVLAHDVQIRLAEKTEPLHLPVEETLQVPVDQLTHAAGPLGHRVHARTVHARSPFCRYWKTSQEEPTRLHTVSKRTITLTIGCRTSNGTRLLDLRPTSSRTTKG